MYIMTRYPKGNTWKSVSGTSEMYTCHALRGDGIMLDRKVERGRFKSINLVHKHFLSFLKVGFDCDLDLNFYSLV